MPVRLSSPADADRAAATTLLSPQWSHSQVATPSTQTRQIQYGDRQPRNNFMAQAERIHIMITRRIQKMSVWQRAAAACGLVILAIAAVVFLVFSEKLFEWINPYALRWKKTTGGWTILWLLTFLAAFPPVIGYSLCGTLAGFIYGVGEGWLILASATVVGSFCSFLVSRTLLRNYVEKMVANDKKFTALTLTLKQDGLKILCMIRLCPLPYSLSNGAMSTFPSVEPHMYALATALVTPKLFVHVFIGSRLAIIAEKGGEMSLGARAVNWLSIGVGAGVGAVTAWLIYNKTMARARELEDEEARSAEPTSRPPRNASRQFSDDPEAQRSGDTTPQDEDDVAYFDDAPSPRPPYSDSQSDIDVFVDGDSALADAVKLQGQRK